ncbi:uncharacterized protein MONBRDRAFT_25453 [Monosiga brevicollis MX1]|uniref:Uncharacterized protein n=1 Tax=Monosiga brevicollis TaxID=81824 RepID=A9UZG9_MONBE|nr:uncharacterized protein MONBRDRAFT_25453 [Monosiga brevicollis MX1]EDQ89366.1 predicted protein [Monosiga brevicollis MX1]|eukprot:XP_001745942.1 hypothetical protein [Monosiga brevicollis MX1]
MEAKIVLLGAQSVGKTSLVLRYVDDAFEDAVSSTIGASFFTHKLTVDGCRVKLQLWDTAGQERFRSMAPMYYRGSSAALIVYDVTTPKSLDEVKGWMAELQRNTDTSTVMCICANKVDLLKDDAHLVEKGRSYAKQTNAIFFETSAKTGAGINEAFMAVVRELISSKRLTPAADQADAIKLAQVSDNTEKKGCC